MKQTAVEWLKLQLEEHGDPQYCELTWKELDELCEQAKAMEKEQIIDAWMVTDNELQRLAAEQYYNETYGKK
jgi:hypothetical protein